MPPDKKREKRITFRVDNETSEALDRYINQTKDRTSSVVHRALHEYLLKHDPEYREAVEQIDKDQDS